MRSLMLPTEFERAMLRERTKLDWMLPVDFPDHAVPCPGKTKIRATNLAKETCAENRQPFLDQHRRMRR
jgi:hypothetical protein